MVNLNQFSNHEKKQMILHVLKENEDGMTWAAIARRLDRKPEGDTYAMIKRLTLELQTEGRIRIVDFGGKNFMKLCKVIQN